LALENNIKIVDVIPFC
jgi:hypothetical protein